MRFSKMSALVLAAGMAVSGATVLAQNENEQTRKDAKHDLKQQEKADKAQAKADKSARKLAGSDKAKKAAADQDKANQQAEKVPQ